MSERASNPTGSSAGRLSSDERAAAANAWLTALEIDDSVELDGLSAATERQGHPPAQPERSPQIDPTIQGVIDAWTRRNDATLFDGLWQAACWVWSGLDRFTPQGRADDSANAREILDNDPVAARAVQDAQQRRPVRIGERGGNRSLTRRDVRPLRRKS